MFIRPRVTTTVFALVLAVVVAALPAQAQQKWSTRETLRLGDSNDPAGTIFGRIVAATVDDAGRIYVMDALSYDVRVFSPTGRLELTMGRRGRGPGEFERPVAMGLIGRTLWASDGTLRRTVFFNAAGRPDSSTLVSYVPPTGFTPAPPVAVASDGSTIIIPNAAGDRMVAPDPDPLPIVRVSSSAKVDTLHLLDLRGIAVNVDMGDGRGAFAQLPLPTAPMRSVATDGSLLAVVEQQGGAASTFRLIVKDGRGRVVGERAVPYTPVRVPAQWRDSVLKSYDRPGAPPAQQQMMRRITSALTFPATFPPVARLQVGADGTVWVRLAGTSSTAHWLVFDSRATQIGSVQLPASMTILHATRQSILASGLSAHGEPVVVRYAVSSGTSGQR